MHKAYKNISDSNEFKTWNKEKTPSQKTDALVHMIHSAAKNYTETHYILADQDHIAFAQQFKKDFFYPGIHLYIILWNSSDTPTLGVLSNEIKNVFPKAIRAKDNLKHLYLSPKLLQKYKNKGFHKLYSLVK